MNMRELKLLRMGASYARFDSSSTISNDRESTAWETGSSPTTACSTGARMSTMPIQANRILGRSMTPY